MFTGIIEAIGVVKGLDKDGSNLHITIHSPFTNELKVDQSIAHNGVCLTVTSVDPSSNAYSVTAISETLQKTNLGQLIVGDDVNLERCVKLGDRLDGHIVQGHVDCTAVCTKITDAKGSKVFAFRLNQNSENQIVKKGSVCVNGVSLTVVECDSNTFNIAIIPYTLNHTNFQHLVPGSIVNIEFDIVGKYILSRFPKDGTA